MRLRTSILCIMAGTTISHAGPLTQSPAGHQIHNRQCFSPDGRFIYYDSRNDETQLALSHAIGRVEISTRREEILHHSGNIPIGAVTCHPLEPKLAFILGIPGLSYAPQLRSGATLDPDNNPIRLDARDVTPPFTAGTLRGGTHAFHWSPSGAHVSFTYNDALTPSKTAPHDLRTIGILIPGNPITVPNPSYPLDFNGTATTCLVVPVTPNPRPGSNDLLRAFDEDWIDDHTLAFQGTIKTSTGTIITELFLATIPTNPLNHLPSSENTAATMPATLGGTTIRRLTNTENTTHPGIQGPRHWVRTSPDRKSIAYLAKDTNGVVQIQRASIDGSKVSQITRLTQSIQDVFDWSPDGKHLACIAGNQLLLINASTGLATPITDPAPPSLSPRYAAVFSPDGKSIATNCPTPHPDGHTYLQIHIFPLNSKELNHPSE